MVEKSYFMDCQVLIIVLSRYRITNLGNPTKRELP